MIRPLTYVVCTVPAVIGVWFLADAAHNTSDSGAAGAAQLGLIAAAAYVGPLVALLVWRNGSRLASAVLWLLTAGAMVANLSQTLDALANRGAGKSAEAAKIVATVRADRSRLERIERERAAMRFEATDASAVAAAERAVAVAERTRAAECEKRGRFCRDREADEAARRAELATAMAGKAATDKARQLDSEAATLTARLDKAPPVPETRSGNLFSSVFNLSPIAAASYQQQVFAALIEAIIAASLCLPELALRRRPPAQAPAPAAPAAPAYRVADALASLQVAGRSRVDLAEVRKLYVAECRSRGQEPVGGDPFAEDVAAYCKTHGIRLQAIDGRVFLLDSERQKRVPPLQVRCRLFSPRSR